MVIPGTKHKNTIDKIHKHTHMLWQYTILLELHNELLRSSKCRRLFHCIDKCLVAKMYYFSLIWRQSLFGWLHKHTQNCRQQTNTAGLMRSFKVISALTTTSLWIYRKRTAVFRTKKKRTRWSLLEQQRQQWLCGWRHETLTSRQSVDRSSSGGRAECWCEPWWWNGRCRRRWRSGRWSSPPAMRRTQHPPASAT